LGSDPELRSIRIVVANVRLHIRAGVLGHDSTTAGAAQLCDKDVEHGAAAAVRLVVS